MKRTRFLSWVSASVLALPSAALASEEAKAGLPQMDVTLFAGQLFWLAIFFSLLYAIMRWNLIPRVERTQEKRQAYIQNDLAEASAASEEARARQEACERDLLAARQKAEKVVDEIILSAEKESMKRQAEQRQKMERHLAETEAKIDAMREKALKDSEGIAEDLAQEIVKKILGGKPHAAGGKA